MIRGIYAAGAGMLAESVRNDVTANNLANANTAGYKKDTAVTKDFHSLLMLRINDGPDRPVIGTLGVGAMVDEVYTTHAPAGVRPTGNAFDLAIEGRGYFAVETPAGIRYTRNGSFSRNAQGEFVTLDGYRVLGENGPIQLGDENSKISISEDGRITVDDVQGDRLRLVDFADPRQLTKEGSSFFIAKPGAQENPAEGLVRQGALEHSGVNVVGEMVNLIAGFRAYEVNGKAVQAHDQLLDKAVNEVGRV